jgi:DNA-binding transcriptional LysR family regulator
MRINLHSLRIFFAVVEHGSFSKAADALFITQPAVSKTVKDLEQQLDLPLSKTFAPASISGAAP